ncbi:MULTISPECIES: phosphoribosyl-AMP cyclohydrolase [Thermaerobacter]|uniref:Histidine biosynthesis bifunctional protein HisIE n=1 Tax=Thermaerobacter composti TaxID=554949 RepID=A0ABZ0QQ56_9FIRM|nr:MULTISPECIES: phosphoribosyl-AMP cyclohydrolase [Thermaerobacter]QBS37527.1 phosphoribosyl-AMP cyclohydrolase [Thermaerobacter sp. FW80]WPD19618.1 phosphoribosyl-AMP cyclohydrolase [Thermaerobacter composti]
MRHTLTAVRFDQRGLVPVVVQDAGRGDVLMLAYADREALARTLAEGRAWFFSRSRRRLWRKGETSGHELRVQEVRIDCDGDAVLYRVDPAGPACHTGQRTCFHRGVDGAPLSGASRAGPPQPAPGPGGEAGAGADGAAAHGGGDDDGADAGDDGGTAAAAAHRGSDAADANGGDGHATTAAHRGMDAAGANGGGGDGRATAAAHRGAGAGANGVMASGSADGAPGGLAGLGALEAVVRQRQKERPPGSYTTRLFEAGLARILQKVGEEAVEAVVAGGHQSRQRLVEEVADLLYHLTVLLVARDVSWQDVGRELGRRAGAP